MNWRVNAEKCETIVLDKRGESITASRNNSIGTIDVTDAMIIEMDIEIHALHTDRGWQSVFHIGNDDNQERLPGIWLGSQSGTEGAYDGFLLAYGTDSNPNEHSEKTAAGGAFTDNMNIHYKSIWTQDHLRILHDDQIIFDKDYETHPTPTNRDVYVSDPWWPAANVTINNLIIKSVEECDCSAIDIDGYLSECSDIFDDREIIVAELRKDVNANTEAIASITDNSGDITTNANDIAANSEAIAKIQQTLDKIADINAE